MHSTFVCSVFASYVWIGPNSFLLSPFFRSFVTRKEPIVLGLNTKCFTFCYHKCQALIHSGRYAWVGACVSMIMMQYSSLFFLARFNVTFSNIHFRHEFMWVLCTVLSNQMNCIRFVHIKDVFLLHQNESGSKQLCKWMKLCEWCYGRRGRTLTPSISFTSTELDLWWGNHAMQNENKTTCETNERIQKRPCRCCQSNIWKPSDAKKTCVSDARSFTVASDRVVYMLLSQSKLATCVHFISFYLWFRCVFERIFLQEKIFISWFKWIPTKWFNVVRHLYPDMNTIKQSLHTHTLAQMHVECASRKCLHGWKHTQKTQLQRIIRFVPRHWCYRNAQSSEQYI